MFNHTKFSGSFVVILLKKRYAEIIIFLLVLCGSKFGGFDGLYINSDGRGYYAYLPALFIYHDYNFSFADKANEKCVEPACSHFLNTINGKHVNKYFIGVSILWLPFFLIAHVLSYVLGFPTDGYSALYQYSILIAALFYLWIGLLYLRKLLIFFKFSGDVIAFSLVLTVFATPLIFYSIFSPDYSHIYSFTLVTLFLYHLKSFSVAYRPINLLCVFIFIGLIILVRPVNVIIVLAVPFIIGSKLKIWRFLSIMFYHKIFVIIGIGIFCLILFMQPLYYKIESGSWFIWAYSGEKFNFLKPHLWKALISYQKGIFVYTPLLFLSLLGFYELFRQNRFRAIYLLVFIFFVIYVLSSWESWGYGMGFGYRPITEYMSFFSILLAYTLQIRSVRIIKIVLFFVLLLAIFYNIILLHQHKHYILHWDAMDKESYCKVFMRTSTKYYGILWNENYSITQPRPGLPVDTIYQNTFEASVLNQSEGYKSVSAYILDRKNGNKLTDYVPVNNINSCDSVIFYVSGYVKPVSIVKTNSLKIFVKFINDTSVVYEKSKRLQILPFRKDKWYYISQVLTVSNPPIGNNLLSIELKNTGHQKFLIDNLIVEQFTAK